jgi:hypothetical protein
MYLSSISNNETLINHLISNARGSVSCRWGTKSHSRAARRYFVDRLRVREGAFQSDPSLPCVIDNQMVEITPRFTPVWPLSSSSHLVQSSIESPDICLQQFITTHTGINALFQCSEALTTKFRIHAADRTCEPL